MGLANIIIDDAAPREKAYKLGSENGLYLLINPSGSRWWRFDYRFEGKRQTLSMGVYPEISLAEARSRRDEARALLREHINPSKVRKQARLAAAAVVKRPPLHFRMTDDGALLIEKKSGRMVLNADQVIALRAFIDAAKEQTPCL